MKEQFKAKMLCLHFTEDDKWQGKPLFEAVVAKCMELRIAGATVYRGLEGFGASARIYHSRSLSISRNAPVVVSIIDVEEKIQLVLPHLDEMLTGGLIALSDVDAIRYSL
jgi:hypothetical protein